MSCMAAFDAIRSDSTFYNKSWEVTECQAPHQHKQSSCRSQRIRLAVMAVFLNRLARSFIRLMRARNTGRM